MGKDTLHRIEQGQRDLTLGELMALAHALGVDADTLIRPAIVAATNRHPGSGDTTQTTKQPSTQAAG